MGSAFVERWYYFIVSVMFYCYPNLLLVHLRLKHRENVFSVRKKEIYKRLLSKGDVVLRLR